MWRKLHTWLLIAVALMLASMFAMEMCHTFDYYGTGERVSIYFHEHTQFLIFTFVVCALVVVALCYSGNYLMQMRLCTLDSILLFAYQIWIFYVFFGMKTESGATMNQYYTLSIAALFPVLAALLLIIIYRLLVISEAKRVFGETIIDVPENVEFKMPKKKWWKKD